MRAVVYNGSNDASDSTTDAPDACRYFDDRDKGWTKVVLNPVTS